ncbi:MAG TPA: hypothetical protein PKK12_03510 [Candidatus Aminicenantes bacterium]|nr:hypothetical protein [Candidatus Aminicenantes bacterium]
MTRTILLILLFLSMILPIPSGPVRTGNRPLAVAQGGPLNHGNDIGGMEDDLSYSYEQEIISRKVFQKRLPPLTARERVIWSFRVTAKSPFL